MLRDVDNARTDLREKIQRGRVRDPEHERVRCRWFKELRDHLETRLDIMEYRDLLEMSERVEKIEKMQEQRTNDFRFK